MRGMSNVSFSKVYFQVWNINIMILTLDRNINIGYLSITNIASIMTVRRGNVTGSKTELYRKSKCTPEMISPPSLLPEGAVTGSSGAADWEKEMKIFTDLTDLTWSCWRVDKGETLFANYVTRDRRHWEKRIVFTRFVTPFVDKGFFYSYLMN